jgi:hypothetical protein
MRRLRSAIWFVAAVVAALAGSVVRIRLYDSEGSYRGITHVGSFPIYPAVISVCLAKCGLAERVKK